MVTLVMLAASLAAPRTGWSQSRLPAPNAEQLFDDARALLLGQDYVEACATFARSFELGHVIGAELNLGICAERDGRFAIAWQRFDSAARDWAQVGDDERSAFARANADRLAIKLATIVVTLPPESFAGATVRIGGRTVAAARQIRELVEPGDVEIVVTVAGRPMVRRSVRATLGAIATIDASREATGSVVKTGPAGPAVTASPAAPWSVRRKLAAGIASGSVALLAVGVGFGVSANAQQSHADTLCRPQLPCARAAYANLLIRAGHDRAITADVLFGIAGAAAITAGALWLTGGQDSPLRVAVIPVASPSGQLVITARGSF